jgi:hypothetical protein
VDQLMDGNIDQLSREIAALTQRLVDLGAKLGEAARELEGAGAPPAEGLVEALDAARAQFVQLRTEVIGAATSVGAAAPAAEPQSLHDLEPVLQSVAAELRARARQAALEEARARVLVVLDRVHDIVHRDDPALPALVECHEKARAIGQAMATLTDPESAEARRVTESLQAFSDLLTMVESREALDDERYAQLEESVSKAFGRSLSVAVARGRLAFASDIAAEPVREPPPPPPPPPPPAPEPEPEPVASMPTMEMPTLELEPSPPPPAPEPEPEPVVSMPTIEMPTLELEPSPPPAPEPAPPPVAPVPQPVAAAPAAPAPAAAPAEPSAPDETAQWWLAAWARWSGWRSSTPFADAVKEEVGKYAYLLSVPIQKSPEYEEGLLAYGYSILMDHVERQTPGCVGNALNSLKPGQNRPVGDQLYEYLVTEGKLRETYADFVKSVLLAAVPEPGLWFQFRILDSKEDTRILQRPSARIGDTELSGQRLASDGQRYAEHKFKMALGPLTTRFVLVSADIKETRGIGVRLLVDGAASDSGWVAGVPAGGKGKADAKRVAEEGTHLPGLGKDLSAAWIAVFNPDPTEDRRCELSVFLRKDAKSPFRAKG